MSFGEWNLRERVAELERENAELHEARLNFERERDYWKRTCVKNAHALAYYIDVANDTRAENDSLRQLVRDLEECRQHPYDDCYGCKHSMGDATCTMEFFDRMAKLGIEVE